MSGKLKKRDKRKFKNIDEIVDENINEPVVEEIVEEPIDENMMAMSNNMEYGMSNVDYEDSMTDVMDDEDDSVNIMKLMSEVISYIGIKGFSDALYSYIDSEDLYNLLIDVAMTHDIPLDDDYLPSTDDNMDYEMDSEDSEMDDDGIEYDDMSFEMTYKMTPDKDKMNFAMQNLYDKSKASKK